MKRSVSLLIISVIFAVGCSGGTSKAKAGLEQYITALKNGDFQTVYELNAVTQKKVALISRGTEQDKEGLLKKNFGEYKAIFDSTQGNELSHAVMSEKILFQKDCTHTITKVIVEKDPESITATFRDRMIARAEVKVSYPNKNTAPVYREEKIKEVTYTVLLISGDDVVRGIQTTNIVKDWLFKNINVKENEATFWPAS